MIPEALFAPVSSHLQIAMHAYTLRASRCLERSSFILSMHLGPLDIDISGSLFVISLFVITLPRGMSEVASARYLMHVFLRCCSRDKAYVPGAKPKADMAQLDKELAELVDSLRPKPEECQRQTFAPHSLPFSVLFPDTSHTCTLLKGSVWLSSEAIPELFSDTIAANGNVLRPYM